MTRHARHKSALVTTLLGQLVLIAGIVMGLFASSFPHPTSATDELVRVEARVDAYEHARKSGKRGRTRGWTVVLSCSYDLPGRGWQRAEVRAGRFPTTAEAHDYGRRMTGSTIPLWADPAQPTYAVMQKKDADSDRWNHWAMLGATSAAVIAGVSCIVVGLRGARSGARPQPG